MQRIDRRGFLGAVGAGVAGMTAIYPNQVGGKALQNEMRELSLPNEWHNLPNEFSMVPFWFWNDDLSEEEIARQLDDFRAHGVHAFVIHPRAGLPR